MDTITTAELDATNRRLDQAIYRLRAECRDVISGYREALRMMDQAKSSLIAKADTPEMFELEATLTPELRRLIDNPSLR